MKTFADYFEIIKFATPETNVRLKNSNDVPKCDDIIVKKCMNWEDVMHLIMADDILTRNEIWVQWYIPYKPFARQDRVTALNHGNESSLLHQLIYDNHLSGRVIFLDVHSDRYQLGKFIHQLSPIEFYNPFGVGDYYLVGSSKHYDPGFHFIVPDKGAQKKVSKLFAKVDLTYCDKKRDPITGKLSGFVVPEIKTNKPLVLIDDICDGGGTFIGLAEHLQKYRSKIKLILYVTHGLFTKGTDELLKFFDEIVTTNSVYEKPSSDKVKVLDVLSEEFVMQSLNENLK